MENYINLLFEIEQMAATLYFMHNTISNVPSGQTTMSGVPEKPYGRSRICIYCEENHINLLFDLEKMAVILDFTIMQCHKVFSGHTPMSGIPENPMVHAKITNLLLL